METNSQDTAHTLAAVASSGLLRLSSSILGGFFFAGLITLFVRPFGTEDFAPAIIGLTFFIAGSGVTFFVFMLVKSRLQVIRMSILLILATVIVWAIKLYFLQ